MGRRPDERGPERQLHVVRIASFADWPLVVGGDGWPVAEGEGFALLLAMDASGIDSDRIGELAEWSIIHGVFAVSTWGTDCERVHDIFDEVHVDVDLARRDAGLLVGRGPVVMTSWHDDVPLDEALEFFWRWSGPDEGLAGGPSRIVLVVGDPSVEAQVRRWARESRA